MIYSESFQLNRLSWPSKISKLLSNLIDHPLAIKHGWLENPLFQMELYSWENHPFISFLWWNFQQPCWFTSCIHMGFPGPKSRAVHVPGPTCRPVTHLACQFQGLSATEDAVVRAVLWPEDRQFLSNGNCWKHWKMDHRNQWCSES